MSRLRVDLERLAALIDRMALVEAQLAEIRADVAARTTHVDWTGAAAARHLEAQARWADGAAQLHDGLAELRAAASTAHGNYLAAAGANRRMWAR